MCGYPVLVFHAGDSLVVTSVSLPMFFAEKNVQVSFDASPNNARSECMLAVNPKNAAHMVGASKRFTNPQAYIFDIAAYVTQDGGMTWKESRPTPPAGVTGISDPTLAFDDQGNVYLVALPYTILGPNLFSTSGIAIYQSTDGGLTWSTPKPLINLPGSDKQDAAGDGNISGRSGFPGRVYTAWDAVGLAFARTVDHGATWVGPGNTVAGTAIPGVTGNFSPALAVGGDGILYIAWLDLTARTIKAIKSTDGGQTFVTSLSNAATNISPVGGDSGGKVPRCPRARGLCGQGRNAPSRMGGHPRRVRSYLLHAYHRRRHDVGALGVGCTPRAVDHSREPARLPSPTRFDRQPDRLRLLSLRP